MKSLVLKIVTELAYYQVITSLKENNIPFTILKQGDSSFPMFGQENFFGRLEVADAYATFIEELITGNEDQIIVEEEVIENITRKKIPFGRILLITYAVIVSIFLFRYWNAYRHFDDDKNFDYVWNSSSTKLFAVNKKTDKVFTASTDINFDLNFEKFQIFDAEEKLIFETFDTNEDGLYETFYRYKNDHTLTEQGFDRNEDGSYEYFEIILENGDRLILKDENGDGAYEYLERKRPSDVEEEGLVSS